MDFEWFSFEESYLLSIDYIPMECKLSVIIDARMSNQHPKVKFTKSREEQFVTIEFLFSKVQYFRCINSLRLVTNKDDDIGSIYNVEFIDSNSVSQEFNINKEHNSLQLTIDILKEVSAEINSSSSNLQFLNFVSEMITFQVGFKELNIKEKSLENPIFSAIIM